MPCAVPASVFGVVAAAAPADPDEITSTVPLASAVAARASPGRRDTRNIRPPWMFTPRWDRADHHLFVPLRDSPKPAAPGSTTTRAPSDGCSAGRYGSGTDTVGVGTFTGSVTLTVTF